MKREENREVTVLFRVHHLVTRIEVANDLAHCEEWTDSIVWKVGTGLYLLWLSWYAWFVFICREMLQFIFKAPSYSHVLLFDFLFRIMPSLLLFIPLQSHCTQNRDLTSGQRLQGVCCSSNSSSQFHCGFELRNWSMKAVLDLLRSFASIVLVYM